MKTIPQISIFGTIEAAEFYKEAFGVTLGFAVKHDDGTYAHLSMMHGDTELFTMGERGRLHDAENQNETTNQFFVNNDNNEKTTSPTVGIGIYGLTKEAIWNAYNVLKKDAIFFNPDGPQSLPWLELDFVIVDKFGVCWEVGTELK